MRWLPGTATGVVVIPSLVAVRCSAALAGVGMVAHVAAVMMCCTVSARYAALCTLSGALT
ncbi:TPA: hypothetical protein ACHKWG_003709 [Escherichia coli]|nr:hypothetical protein [Escherichia coli]